MQPPDELMTDVFLPGIRQLVASELRSRNLSQSRIASLLGVTQASVSVYLASDAEKAYRSLARLTVSRSEADRDTLLLADALQSGPVEGVRTLHQLWTRMLGAGSVCSAHRETYPTLADCEFCIEEYARRPAAVSDAISEVSSAVKLLEQSLDFPSVMPEVSVNIACVAGDAATPAEVVAIPGRIVKVRDRAKAMLPPEAGASAHMSKVLILVRRRKREFRAVINLRYDHKMDDVLRESGLKALHVGERTRREGEDPTARALEHALVKHPGQFDVLVDEGGSGIEPNVYLFAKGAREAARLAIKLARSYSAA